MQHQNIQILITTTTFKLSVFALESSLNGEEIIFSVNIFQI